MKLLELVNPRKLIYGQKYYMKRSRPCCDIIFYGYMQYDEAFDSYSENDIEVDNFAWVKCLNPVMGVIVSNDIIEIDVDMNKFYRYISKEEYFKKLKEKYDVKCLNIVLKRIINETFIW